MNQNEDRELGWDDEIANDDQGQFTLVPPGIYPFEIVNVQKGRFEPRPNGKLPACNKVELTVRVYHDDEYTDISDNQYLHSRMEGKLCAFFKAIGHRKHGEPLRMHWDRVLGAKGKCKVQTRKWKGDDGVEREGNEIKSYIDPSSGPQQSAISDAPQPQYTQGQQQFQQPPQQSDGF